MTELLKAYRTEVYDRAHEIDPDNELDWYDMAVGWALGKGLKPKAAHALATEAIHVGVGDDQHA